MTPLDAPRWRKDILTIQAVLRRYSIERVPTAATTPEKALESLQRIVAVLEAAEALIPVLPVLNMEHHDCDGSEFCSYGGYEARHHVYYCEGCDVNAPCDCDVHEGGMDGAYLRAWERMEHDDECPLGALVAALMGEGA